METIGWIGSALLALCAVPETYKTIKLKRCDIGWGMLTTWLLGEIGLFIFEFNTDPTLQRSFNYLLNLICISIMVFYKRRS